MSARSYCSTSMYCSTLCLQGRIVRLTCTVRHYCNTLHPMIYNSHKIYMSQTYCAQSTPTFITLAHTPCLFSINLLTLRRHSVNATFLLTVCLSVWYTILIGVMSVPFFEWSLRICVLRIIYKYCTDHLIWTLVSLSTTVLFFYANIFHMQI